MMKMKDVQVATALIIQGYLRANDGEVGGEPKAMADVVSAIRQEVEDWAENIAIEPGVVVRPEDLSVEVFKGPAPVSRSPHNLVAAILALAAEVVDLAGPEMLSAVEAKLAEMRAAEAA